MSDDAPIARRISIRHRRRRIVIAGAGVLVLLWAASTFLVTWRLTRRQGFLREEVPPAISVRREDLTLETDDGERLGAWLYEGLADRPCVLVMHGIRSCRSDSHRLIRRLLELGCTVLAVTLRAHGDSTGDVVDVGWSSRRDVVAAVRFLRKRLPDRPIAVCGRSMSSAAAIFAAHELGSDVAGYWLEQPYPTLDSAVWRRLQAELPPVFDYSAFIGMRLWGTLLLKCPLRDIAPVEHIAAIPESCPVWLLCGDADRHLPPKDFLQIADRIRHRARIVMFPEAGHVLLDEANPGLFDKELTEFLHQVEFASTP